MRLVPNLSISDELRVLIKKEGCEVVSNIKKASSLPHSDLAT
jgi:hypothetical protein